MTAKFSVEIKDDLLNILGLVPFHVPGRIFRKTICRIILNIVKFDQFKRHLHQMCDRG
jgi:hypothetical protein